MKSCPFLSLLNWMNILRHRSWILFACGRSLVSTCVTVKRAVDTNWRTSLPHRVLLNKFAFLYGRVVPESLSCLSPEESL